MKLVVVVSPFREANGRSREEHRLHALRLCLLAARAGHAVFASHGFYPLFLDEDLPADRELGLAMEREVIARSDMLWIWDPWGLSSGMTGAIQFAKSENLRWAETQAKDYPTNRREPIAICYFSKDEVPAWKTK